MSWIKDLKEETKPQHVIEQEKREAEAQMTQEIKQIVHDKFFELWREAEQTPAELIVNGINLSFSHNVRDRFSLQKAGKKDFTCRLDVEGAKIHFDSEAGSDVAIYNRVFNHLTLSIAHGEKGRDPLDFDALMKKHIKSLL